MHLTTCGCSIYCKLLKIRPLPFWTLLWGKSGRGHLLKYSISLVHTPPQFLMMLRLRLIITTTTVISGKMASNYTECKLIEISMLILYSGKLSREKTFANFGFVAIRESFLCKIGGMVSFGTAKASNLRKFSQRNHIFHQFAKVFSLESFPLYDIILRGKWSSLHRRW